MNRSTIARHLPSFSFFLGVLLTLLITGTAFLYFGAYNVAADAPHTRPVYALFDTLRQRSIEVRAKTIEAPRDLASPERVRRGASLYAEMCTSCHLAPGMAPSELSKGLYPRAPELVRDQRMSPAEQFWTIKHGVKLSAMPSWGNTHTDPLIWDIVAFVRELPKMSAEQYRTLTASAPASHDMMMEGSHQHGDGHD